MPTADHPQRENCQRCGSLRLRSVQAAAFPSASWRIRGGISSPRSGGAKCAVPICSFSERGFGLIQEYCTTSNFFKMDCSARQTKHSDREDGMGQPCTPRTRGSSTSGREALRLFTPSFSPGRVAQLVRASRLFTPPDFLRTVSSVGRASALHAEGRRFESCTVQVKRINLAGQAKKVPGSNPGASIGK